MRAWHWLTSPNFNPRSPWGERLNSYAMRTQFVEFQSTLPAGGATKADFPFMQYGT